MPFKLVTSYQPAGDQPKAIQDLVDGVNEGEQYQTYIQHSNEPQWFSNYSVAQHL